MAMQKITAKAKTSPASFKVGDSVRILRSPMKARIVERRGPLGPGGVQIYRVRVLRSPDRLFKSHSQPTYIELREDQFRLVAPRGRAKKVSER